MNKKVNPVEETKEQSNYLRGQIAQELREPTDHFQKESAQLLKFHGTYQQDDRDARSTARTAGDGKAYMMMVRLKIPGGALTSDQLLTALDLGDALGNQTLRITSRQGLQFHGVLKSHLWEMIHRVNQVALTTWGACGDVNRNVMCCPAPRADTCHSQIQALAAEIAEHFAPRTRAYHEIWLQEFADGALLGEKQRVAEPSPEEVEPIYGRHYLPRKFKMGIALPDDNCIDVYTQDVGLIALPDGGDVRGYNILVGGGLGVTPSAQKTFPALGKPLCFALPHQVLDLLTAIVKVQRDHGNREDRKTARLKYLVADWGLPRFRETVEAYWGARTEDPWDVSPSGFDDHLGWHPQGNGKWFYGLNVENGRIKDQDSRRLKSAIREICQRFRPGIRLTSHQSLLFTDLDEGQQSLVERILCDHGVPRSEDVSQVRRWSMACVAWPTCGLAITESERALPGIVDQLEQELARLNLSGERFTLRMTGCPNGCARPYNADIGLVGKTKGKYTIYLGGRLLGNRLAYLYKDLVPEEDLVRELTHIFQQYRDSRLPGETLGDFCHRMGTDQLTHASTQTPAGE